MYSWSWWRMICPQQMTFTLEVSRAWKEKHKSSCWWCNTKLFILKLFYSKSVFSINFTAKWNHHSILQTLPIIALPIWVFFCGHYLYQALFSQAKICTFQPLPFTNINFYQWPSSILFYEIYTSKYHSELKTDNLYLFLT